MAGRPIETCWSPWWLALIRRWKTTTSTWSIAGTPFSNIYGLMGPLFIVRESHWSQKSSVPLIIKSFASIWSSMGLLQKDIKCIAKSGNLIPLLLVPTWHWKNMNKHSWPTSRTDLLQNTMWRKWWNSGSECVLPSLSSSIGKRMSLILISYLLFCSLKLIISSRCSKIGSPVTIVKSTTYTKPDIKHFYHPLFWSIILETNLISSFTTIPVLFVLWRKLKPDLWIATTSTMPTRTQPLTETTEITHLLIKLII